MLSFSLGFICGLFSVVVILGTLAYYTTNDVDVNENTFRFSRTPRPDNEKAREYAYGQRGKEMRESLGYYQEREF